MSDIDGKSGIDLFRELLRVYSEAAHEEYFVGGTWTKELMRTDYALYVEHRREAGANDPPPLEEVPMPQLPQGLAKPLSALPKLSPVTAGAVAPASGPLAELHLIASFIAKHKLDPMRAKGFLAALNHRQ